MGPLHFSVLVRRIHAVIQLTVHSKSKSEFLDPCQDFASKSIRCLHRNGGERAMCQDYFQWVFLANLL